MPVRPRALTMPGGYRVRETERIADGNHVIAGLEQLG